jgi:CheY-like chemotaxis protein
MVAASKPPTRHDPRVLVVDDDPVFRRLAVARLQKVAHGTAEAEDGMEAWHFLKGGDYDLALVDLEMPNMNGFALMRCVRTFPATQQMPLVVVSSHDDLATVQKAFQAGATGFLTKPINWSMFLPYVKHLLGLAKLAEAAHILANEQAALAEVRGLIAEILTAELRSRSRRIAAAAGRAKPGHDQELDTAARTHALEIALNEANAQRRTVEILAPYTELTTQSSSARAVICPLRPLIRDVAARCQPFADESQISLRFSDDVAIDVHCPRDAFTTCVADIVRHAIAKAPAGATVHVNVLVKANEVAIAVTGPGAPIDPHLALHFGERDRARATPQPPLSDQAVVGLLMASSLARMIGAHLAALPDQGTGNTIVLTLPVVSAPPAAEPPDFAFAHQHV